MSADSEPAKSTAEITVAGKTMTLAAATDAAKGGASWFWWIAGLSIVNSFAALLEADYGMLLGLGVTQILDVVLLSLLSDPSAETSIWIRIIYLGLLFSVSGFFYFVGVKARELHLWAFNLGKWVYAADAIVFVIAQDWIAVGFHVFAFIMIQSGQRFAQEIHRQARA